MCDSMGKAIKSVKEGPKPVTIGTFQYLVL